MKFTMKIINANIQNMNAYSYRIYGLFHLNNIKQTICVEIAREEEKREFSCIADVIDNIMEYNNKIPIINMETGKLL